MENTLYQRCRVELARYEAEKAFPEGFISLNKEILDIQESVRAQLGPAPGPSPEGLAQMEAGEPALSVQLISVPTPILRDAATSLAAVFSRVAGADFPLDALLALSQLQTDNAAAFVEDILADRIDLDAVAQSGPFNVETVSYFIHSLIVPFLEPYAESYQPMLDSHEILWRRGVCPVCGAFPRYSFYYGEKGFRKVYCGLCRAQWSYPRHKCPYCENPERAGFKSLKLGKDEAHQAVVCDSCQMYIKTTDERPLLRECLPMAEDIVTANIDLAAAAEGFSRPA